MSMNREEAINRIENHMEVHGIGEYPHIKLKEALEIALTALRPVSREQVEKMWRGCRSCKSCRSCVYNIHDLKDMPCKKCDPNAEGIVTEYKPGNFCQVCGKPLTDEAVEMVMERLGMLYDC